jgi:site-specific DNA-methyltransferase (cytosine-N4-specific)
VLDNTGDCRPYYRTELGSAWVGDSRELLTLVPAGSVQAIITSPPFALRTRKAYGNAPPEKYGEWFMGFAEELRRVLTDDGSLVIELGGSWARGRPVRTIYNFELLVALVRNAGFHLAEEFYWYNRAKIPGPAQWVNVERIRVKDAITPIWWLSKADRPKADNRRVLKAYSQGMLDLFKRGYNEGPRPSGHRAGSRFGTNNGGAIPSNLIETAHTASRGDPYHEYCRREALKRHPARFAPEVPEFFIRFLTEPGDLILDPFAGSNVTGAVAEDIERRWLAFELDQDYLDGSIGRFESAALVDRRDARAPTPLQASLPEAG